MSDLGGLRDLREHGKMRWSDSERAWRAEPQEVVTALANAGFQEYKREVTRSRRDREPTGGVWQGLDTTTGAVASAIWVSRADTPGPIVFIDINGEPLTEGGTA
jgi:hypothetical protein